MVSIIQALPNENQHLTNISTGLKTLEPRAQIIRCGDIEPEVSAKSWSALEPEIKARQG